MAATYPGQAVRQRGRVLTAELRSDSHLSLFRVCTCTAAVCERQSYRCSEQAGRSGHIGAAHLCSRPARVLRQSSGRSRSAQAFLGSRHSNTLHLQTAGTRVEGLGRPYGPDGDAVVFAESAQAPSALSRCSLGQAKPGSARNTASGASQGYSIHHRSAPADQRTGTAVLLISTYAAPSLYRA